MTSTLISARRAYELLWAHLRLVVIDVETLWETSTTLPEDADEEVKAAIELVRTTGSAGLLRPRSRRIRRLQHRVIEAAGLTSQSSGDEPDRAVEIRPGTGSTLAPAQEPAHDGRHRAISIALVEVVNGKVKPKPWHSLVNPGVPVDPASGAIHHLTTQQLASAPAFPKIAAEIVQRLTPAPGETLVLVGHNVAFDVGVLRTEFELIARPLPDLVLLDTGGSIVRTVGLHPKDATLGSLLAALRITHSAPHTATGDAIATAAAANEILRLASEKGVTDAPALMQAVGSQRSGDVPAPGRIRPARVPTVVMPTAHLERHSLLPARPTKTRLTAWVNMADECAELRCPDLASTYDSLVRHSSADPETLLDALALVLERRATKKDGPGANTVLGAIGVLFERACPMPPLRTFSGRYALHRKHAIETYNGAMNLVEKLPRCGYYAACPACRAGDACPRSNLARLLAPAVLDPTWVNGRLTRASTLMSWLRPDRTGGWFFHRKDPATTPASKRAGAPAGPALADAATALLMRAWASYGEETDRVATARNLVIRMLDEGCADPALIEMGADLQAAGGRPADLQLAIAKCDDALLCIPSYPDAAWTSLSTTRDLLAGRLSRIGERKRVCEDGTTETVRRHHPGAGANRIRPLRFARAPEKSIRDGRLSA